MPEQQRGHMQNLELGAVSTLPECNSESEQGHLLSCWSDIFVEYECVPEQQRGHMENLELGAISTLPECNSEPELDYHIFRCESEEDDVSSCWSDVTC